MKIAIIGSSGSMGSFFTNYFVGKGHPVTGYDPRRARKSPAGFKFAHSSSDAVRSADVVLIAVPSRETVMVVAEIVPYMKRGSTLVEITSVKGKTLAELKRIAKGNGRSLLSLHPLFGPFARQAHLKICVIGNEQDLSVARRLFPEASLVRLSLRKHDRLMAYTLSLVHLLNVSFISALTKGVGVKEFKKIATPMGSSQLRLGQAVLSQDPALFSRIQVENPFVPDVLSAVISELENARRMAQTNDSSGFEKRFAALSGEFKREELDDALRTVYEIS